MFSRPKNWLAGGIWRPKNPHSLEHLKFLYSVLCKNQTVNEQNKSLLVETLRSISEILIWGDQNDSSVFDFFLEKNMLAFFLRFMRQKSGRYICVQLLQTLNILFENISNETSVYYLLSNNHINSIIVHKFDFSDEEVMAYYISFLKTLSLKLNKHTIHFFYNEHTNDFALYTEAIKFFNHSESMVRIAVRTITLNVYKVDDKSMLRYIRDKTAAPYFSNLVWFIGNHIIELDSCVRNDADHNSRDRLSDLVAEHLDHLHYLNDILCLGIDALNDVLTDHLLNRLLLPLYVYSLTKRKKYTARTDGRPHVSSVVSLFLLSQVFLILSHAPLVRQLAQIIFNGDINVCLPDAMPDSPGTSQQLRGFVKPSEPLAQTLESNRGPSKPLKRPNYKNDGPSKSSSKTSSKTAAAAEPSTGENSSVPVEDGAVGGSEVPPSGDKVVSPGQNSTDEEKLLISGTSAEQRQAEFSLSNRPYLEAIFNALECSENDYEALFALCLLYAMGHNAGINQELLDSVLMPTDKSETKDHYNIALVEKLIKIISLSCQNGSRVRLATLEMSILLLKQLVYREEHCSLQDRHLAAIEGAREESTLLLRNFYKSEEIFLDMFEDEYREMTTRPLNVEYLTMDASILLPPTGTPLTGIDFNKRLPCGEVERARRAIRVFFLLRDLSLTLRQEAEAALPLTRLEECVQINDVLDLNNSDLIACTVTTRDNRRDRRFLVIDVLQLILVEPDSRRLGWGVVKFVGFLQDVEVTGDKDDSRSLHITIHKPSMNMHARPLPLLSARFTFDDHIRCMAAKQRLSKGRLKARQRKMQMIARLLELPTHIVESIYPSPSLAQSAVTLRSSPASGGAIPGRSRLVRVHAAASEQSSNDVKSRPAVRPGGAVSKVKKNSGASSSNNSNSHSRPASQPVPIRGGGGGRAKSTPPKDHQGSPEIEEAQEAQPSPEAHAFLSLNPPQPGPEPRTIRGGRSSSTDRPRSPLQEIPLEDLSKKAKAALSSASEFLSSRRPLTAAEVTKARSSSHSPLRGRSHSSPSTASRGRSSPLSGSPTSRSRAEARSAPGRERSGSYPSPHQVNSADYVIRGGGGRGSKNSLGQTSFTVQPRRASSSSYSSSGTGKNQGKTQASGADNVSAQCEAAGTAAKETRKRKNSGPGPKTLTPAPEPAASLLTTDAPSIKTVVTESPKLLPPTDTERIRSLSDISTGSSVESEGTARPPLSLEPNTTPTVDVNDISADAVQASSGAGSAVSELSRLSQAAQEHYTPPMDSDSVELAPVVEPDNQAARPKNGALNATDDVKEQTLHS